MAVDTDLPDWLQPGKTVAVWRSYYNEPQVALEKVARLTKTQIIMADGNRYRKDPEGYNPYPLISGSSNGYNPLKYGLRDPKSPEVRDLLWKQRVSAARRELLEALAEAPSTVTEEVMQDILDKTEAMRRAFLTKPRAVPTS